MAKRLVIPALCTALLSFPAAARAGGLAAARFGGELGNPTTGHPTALYFNPAGLALGTGTRIYAEGVLVYRSASYDRPVAAIDNVLEDGEMGSGTPEGVGMGRTPPVWLKDGDRVAVEIDGIGRLENPVIAEA